MRKSLATALLVLVVAIAAALHFFYKHQTGARSTIPSTLPSPAASPAASSASLNRGSTFRAVAKHGIAPASPPSASPLTLPTKKSLSQTRPIGQPSPVIRPIQPEVLPSVAHPSQSRRSPPPLQGSAGLPPGVPYASDSDPVRIESVLLSSDEVHGGDLATAKVLTTSNAAALTARIGTYQVSVPKTAPGTFEIAIKVPHMPVLGQSVDIVVTAIRTDGATDQRIVPVKVSF